MIKLSIGKKIATNAIRQLDILGISDFMDSLDFSRDIHVYLGDRWDQFDKVHHLICNFLLLGKEIENVDLNIPLIKKLVEALEPFDVIVFSPSGASLGGLSLVRFRGVWLFVETQHVGMTLYFGGDSIGLARRLRVHRNGKALDLCSGPGIQALVLALSGMHVTSIDINPLASKLCSLNAELNGVKDLVEVYTSNLYDVLPKGCSYDLIVANPPLLPIPRSVPYPFIGDGGIDGLTLTTRILNGAKTRLTQEGMLILIGMTTGTIEGINTKDKIKKALASTGLSGCMTIINTYDVSIDSGYVRGIAATSAAFAHQRFTSMDEAIESVYEGYHSMNCESVCTFVLRAWKDFQGLGSLYIQDISSTKNSQGTWIL